MQLTDRVQLVPGGTHIGICHAQGEAFLVDSGLNERSAQRAMDAAQALGLRVRALINTHSHTDHSGGNEYLQQTYGLEVYASAIDAAIMENPALESMYLYSTAAPCALQQRFLLPQPSKDVRVVQPGPFSLLGMDVEILPLPGHLAGQIGILHDGVLFCGDSIYSEKTLQTHPIMFMHDVEKSLESLAYLENCDYTVVASHMGAVEGHKELARYNISALELMVERVHECLQVPRGREEVVQQLHERYGVETGGVQFYLVFSAVCSFIHYLMQKKRAEPLDDGIARFRAI